MESLRTLVSRARALPLDDVDTDVIYPARFLLITQKRGLGRYAFADRRGADFPIGDDGLAGAHILVAGRNFGCGSSREQAVWALADLGVRGILAPSFGEIFESNCFKNGLLAVRLSDEETATARRAAEVGEEIAIDVAAQTIRSSSLGEIGFAIRPERQEALLAGWNEITRIRALHRAEIDTFEAAQRGRAPWLWTKDVSDG